MKNIYYLLVILFISYYSFGFTDCDISFKEIGIREFKLGTDYNSFKLKNKNNLGTIKIVDDKKLITFIEKIKILDRSRVIIYNLIFKNNLLIGYNFKIKIELKKAGLEYFDNVLKKLNKNNDKSFINGDNYAFMKTNKDCSKFFRICDFDSDKYIYGGVITEQ